MAISLALCCIDGLDTALKHCLNKDPPNWRSFFPRSNPQSYICGEHSTYKDCYNMPVAYRAMHIQCRCLSACRLGRRYLLIPAPAQSLWGILHSLPASRMVYLEERPRRL